MSSHTRKVGRRLRCAQLLLFCLVVACASTYALDHTRSRQGDVTTGKFSPPAEAALKEKSRREFESMLKEKMRREMQEGRSPEERRRLAVATDTGIPVGSKAPALVLPDSKGNKVRLDNSRGERPTVLVFGSFGCNLFCNDLSKLRRLRDVWGSQVEFLFVYITEAPHKGASPLPRKSPPPPPAGPDFASRSARVRWYEAASGAGLTWLIDSKGAAERAYNAWPRRLVVVGTDGRVVLDAGHGLASAWDLTAVETGLKQALGASATQ